MRLSILIFCFFHGTCWTSDHYCLYQPRSIHVKEGESVTIPCSYTYPEYIRGKSQVTILWGEGDRLLCSKIKKYITDSSGNITDEYKDRISRVTHPDTQTESLIIRGLKASDGITFCCRATEYRSGSNPYTWSDIYGTSLTFEDGDKLSQVEELMAVPGEEVVVPCHYSQETLGEVTQVIWYGGHDALCANNNNIYSWDPTPPRDVYPYSLVNPPEDVSLCIHKLQGNAYRYFCCRVITSNGAIQKGFGTGLTITGPPSSSPPFTVTQPYKITGHGGESVTLNCSYTSYMERDVLGATIYWRLGNLSGPYVYHPYKEMVHPGYRGRTEIQGAADLHIQGLKMSDDSIYYCFVMTRVCTGNEYYNKLLQYGEGTRLIVTESPDKQSLVVIGSISGVVLFILLCMILVILKTTGVICKKKNVSDEMKASERVTTLLVDEPLYYEIPTKNKEHDEGAKTKDGAKDKRMGSKKDEEKIENSLYSELN